MKPTLFSLLATVTMLGGWVEVAEELDNIYRVTVFDVAAQPLILRCRHGDDEQLRAILQSLLRSISGSSLRL